MEALTIALFVVIGVTSVLMVMLVLMHKGKGGGMSDMFGGGMSSSLGSSGVAERNLNRLTALLAVIWFAAIVVTGLVISLG